MRFAFVGAVKGSRIALEALIAAGLPPALVVALPRAAAGRHSDFADVGEAALAAGVPVVEERDINAAAVVEALREYAIDVSIVAGWSQICGPAFLAATPGGAVGYHPSPLPRMRGRAVIPWTILAGVSRTASTLFWLDEGCDSGPIIAQQPIDIDPDETATTLYAKHNAALAAMLPDAVRAIAAGAAAGAPQDERLATYCAKRTADDGLIDWSLPGADVVRLVRAVADPYPGAFTFQKGGRIAVHEARLHPAPERFLGLPGQIQAVGGEAFVVRCGDGACVEVTAWSADDGIAPKLHQRLNGWAR